MSRLKYQNRMLSKSKYITFILALGMSFSGFSQTKEDLKKQKLAIEKEISFTTELLNKTKANKSKSLNYLKVLNKQINNKERLLQTLNIEIRLTNKQIKKTGKTIRTTEQSILDEQEKSQSLKSEYAKMIYVAFKKKGNRNDLMFVVSAENFNQAYKRIIYLKQYASFRKNQAYKIIESQKKLEKRKENLKRQEKQLLDESSAKKLLVGTKKEELSVINNAKQEKQELVNKLSKSEKVFKKQLQEKQKKARALDDKIRKIIEEEIRKAREEAEKRKDNKGYSLTPEAIALSSGFKNNKGKLPWPLEKGVIVQRYGKQKHSIFAGVETVNNGIDIATDKNTIVRAIFDGTISRIFFIKGNGKAILINHGEYFSVYSGLKEVSVKTGGKIMAKEPIAKVLTEVMDQKTELHFEIWKGFDKQDPSKWLFKAY